ncbi:MAG: sulfurtransferase TusA family protein [Desulfobacteraceae bacterium]
MSTVVDARGLSCPQPALMILEEIKKLTKGEIEILVDTDTSRENVSRAAESQQCHVQETREEGEGYRIKITKD